MPNLQDVADAPEEFKLSVLFACHKIVPLQPRNYYPVRMSVYGEELAETQLINSMLEVGIDPADVVRKAYEQQDKPA